MAVTKEEVIDFISNMSVLELSVLIKEFEEKFGVSAAAPVAVAAAGAVADAPADAQVVDDVKLVVEHAEGEVCDRCRMTTTDVGSDARYPHFCARCAKIVSENFPETAEADFEFEA